MLNKKVYNVHINYIYSPIFATTTKQNVYVQFLSLQITLLSVVVGGGGVAVVIHIC